ncbi:MAG: TerB family tellurite resistance protein [Byssovorax sp.]
MEEPSAAASASLVIHKPASTVRAQFFDVDHAIRDKIHHGIELRWLAPEAPGEKRVERVTKLMTRTHVDVVVIEEGEGGAWVMRFAEGPSKGTRLVGTFRDDGEGQTRVTLKAFPGPIGYFGALGKLSQLGIEKSLQKLLEEHQRALEGYEPERARGAVREAVAAMRSGALFSASGEGQGRAVMTNLLEAACVVAVADDHADPAEREVIQEVARALCFIDLDAAAVDRMVQNVAKAVKNDGIEQRCDKIGARLSSIGLGELGMRVAVLVAQVSHGIGAPELATLQRLAAATGIGEVALRDMIHAIDQDLSRRPAG